MSEPPSAESDAGVAVAATGRVEPITCTYNGTDKYGDPTSPWVFRDDIDRWAPILECDVHGLPAQWPVYNSSDFGPYSGPCEFYEPAETTVLSPGGSDA
jgi:hypothetical protein